MAIFIASTKSISRGKGQSAVASASYRAGVELEDKRYGKTHDYSKRHGVMSADIILPSALAAANVDIDRADLWNKAEAAENRKDARVAREWLVNLPYELSEADRKAIAHKFAQTLADRYGTIADCAIHKPTDKEIARGADPRNFHAHIMFTTRTAALDAHNKVVLVDKATVELSDTKRRSLGLPRVSEEIKAVRLIWEQIANEKLLEHDHELIDSRSYAEQGIDILPQIKMGVDATHLERRTGEISIRGEVNRLIAERNSLVWGATLANNQRINDFADKTLADLHESKLFFVPPPPKPTFKASKVTATDLASANATADKIKTVRLNREQAQKNEQERLRQQQVAFEALIKQEQAEKEKLEHQQRQDRIAIEKAQFEQYYKQLQQQPVYCPPQHLKAFEANPEFKEPLSALIVTDSHMRALIAYQDDPSTSKHQKGLATRKYEHLGHILGFQAQAALTESKNTRHTVTQRSQVATLRGLLDDMVSQHQSNLSRSPLEGLQKVSAAIDTHSSDINRSRSRGLGF